MTGLLLWRREVSLNPSVAVGDQLSPVARRMIRDFESHLPNQGHVVVDPLIGSAIYIEAGIKVVQVDFGPTSQVEVGDAVQWIQVTPQSFDPLLQGGAQVTVFAEGTVLRKSQGLAIVQLDRMTKGFAIKEFQMVRAPREVERFSEMRIKEGANKGLASDLVVRASGVEENYRNEHRPVAATLSVVASVAAFLLLAF